MMRAVASRPVEQFETQVTLPNWQIEGEEGNWTGEPDDFLMVDPDGNPIPEGPGPRSREDVAPRPEPAPAEAPAGEELNEEWLDRVTRRPPPPPRDPPPPPAEPRA
jgi:penicillin-binding protein 1A